MASSQGKRINEEKTVDTLKYIPHKISTDLERHESFQNGLAAAPACISILGQLNLIACKIDFPLQREDTPLDLKVLKYPKSFRACLTQVSNLGHGAFLKAQTNMSAIVKRTIQVPSNVTDIYEILTEGEEEDFDDLPDSMKTIRSIVENCEKEALEVVNDFDKVLEAMNELQEATLNKKGESEGIKRNLEKDIKTNEMIEEDRKKVQEIYEKEKKDLEATFKKEKDQYDQALNDLTSGKTLWTQIGLGLADVVTNQVIPMAATAGSAALMAASMTNLESLGAAAIGAYGLKKKMEKNSESNTGNGMVENNESGGMKGNDVLLEQIHLAAIKRDLKDFTEFFENEALKPEETLSKDEVQKAMDKFEMTKTELKKLENEEDANRKFIAALKKPCKDAINLGNKIKERKVESKKLWKTLQELLNEVNDINPVKYVKSKPKSNQNSSSFFGSKNYVENHVGNLHSKVELTKQALGTTREELEKSKEREMENLKKIQETLVKLSTLQLEKDVEEKILAVIKEGLKAFADLKRQWVNILIYFKEISQLIKISMNEPLTQFMEQSEKLYLKKSEDPTKKITNLQKKRLSAPAVLALKSAFQVYANAQLYVQMSQKYFMPLLAQLGQFIALDPTSDEDKIKAEQLALVDKAQEAENFVQSQVNDFHDKMKLKYEKIETSEMKMITFEE